MSNNSSPDDGPIFKMILPFRQKATLGQPGRQLTHQHNLTPADLTNELI